MAEIGKTTPKVGMRFRDSEEAWEFWVDYGGHVGFDVRKRSTIKSRSDGVITSRWFVCSNEGHRRKNQTDHEPKRIRAKTRTNCKAHVIVTYDRVAKKFEVTEVDLEHNHRLQLPQTRHLLASQRKISELQAFEIETADDSGIMPKAAHEFACRRVGGNLSYTCRDQKNHLRSKRQRELAPHIQDLLNASTSAMNELCKDKENVDPNVQQVDDELLRSARLKKKEVKSKNLRRKKTWIDKLLKGKHRVTKGPTKQGEKSQNKKDGVQQKKKDGVQPQVEVEKYDNNKEVNLVLQECNNIASFTQLLTADLDDLF